MSHLTKVHLFAATQFRVIKYGFVSLLLWHLMLLWTERTKLLEANSLHELLLRLPVLCEAGGDRRQPQVSSSRIHCTALLTAHLALYNSCLSFPQSRAPLLLRALQRCDLHCTQRLSVQLLATVVCRGDSQNEGAKPLAIVCSSKLFIIRDCKRIQLKLIYVQLYLPSLRANCHTKMCFLN